METILSAAIRYKPKRDNKYHIVYGANHAECINQFAKMNLSRNLRDLTVEQQGFITSSNRFVDRIEALKIAKEASQVALDYSMDELYSEFVKYEIN